MNDLFSGFSRRHPDNPSVEMTGTGGGGGVNLDQFFTDVEVINNDLRDLEQIRTLLGTSHEHSKTLHNAGQLKDLRWKIDTDVSQALTKAKLVKVRLEALDRSNAANRTNSGCGPGSSSDRTRTSVVNGLRKKLRDSMAQFNELREKMAAEYRETVERRYYTVTGERAEEAVLDALISTGQSETFLQKAIGEQGRGEVMEAVAEIQERHAAVKEVERSLNELNQVFVDMAVLVERQGADLEDIESHVNRASSFVRGGTQNLQVARKHQRNTRKWACIGIAILLLLIFILVLSLQPWKKKN